MKKALLYLILAGFGLFSSYVVYVHGYLGLFEAGMANLGTTQILLDLVICCAIFISWMLKDASQRGLSAWPYVLMTLAGGSLGVLVYLIRREYVPAPAPALG